MKAPILWRPFNACRRWHEDRHAPKTAYLDQMRALWQPEPKPGKIIPMNLTGYRAELRVRKRA